MSPAEYRELRQARGTQQEVAAKLGVRQSTISDRETGRREITKEAELAMRSVPPKETPEEKNKKKGCVFFMAVRETQPRWQRKQNS